MLRPDPMVAELIRGVLARAVRLYPVQLHDFRFLSNHYHLLLTVESAQRLADFMRYLNSNLAREVGRAVDWQDRFWGRRYQAVLVDAGDEASQVARLVYLLSQGTKENLVASPREWPGPSGLESLLTGCEITGRWFDRTLAYRAARARVPLRPDELWSVERLELTPLPCWQGLDDETRRRKVEGLVRAIEEEAAQRASQSGKPPLGRERVLRQDRHARSGHLRKSPVPLIHSIRAEVRHACRRAYRAYFEEFRRAAAALRRGAREVFFPEGCFPSPLPFVATAPL